MTAAKRSTVPRARQLLIPGTEPSPEEEASRVRTHDDAGRRLLPAVHEYLDAADAWHREMTTPTDWRRNLYVTAQSEGRCDDLRDLVVSLEAARYAPTGHTARIYAAARRFVRARVAMERGRGVDDYERAHELLRDLARAS